MLLLRAFHCSSKEEWSVLVFALSHPKAKYLAYRDDPTGDIPWTDWHCKRAKKWDAFVDEPRVIFGNGDLPKGAPEFFSYDSFEDGPMEIK